MTTETEKAARELESKNRLIATLKDPDVCPYCDSRAESTEDRTEGDRHYFEMRCTVCDKPYSVVFGLEGVLCEGLDESTGEEWHYRDEYPEEFSEEGK
ncbi:MAG: hypothetical protein FVQ81_02170 [Candidatus Glassbacteria bacterium]|nr:hypothetical protein [Candidatus Glassbacteria bacterium]